MQQFFATLTAILLSFAGVVTGSAQEWMIEGDQSFPATSGSRKPSGDSKYQVVNGMILPGPIIVTAERRYESTSQSFSSQIEVRDPMDGSSICTLTGSATTYHTLYGNTGLAITDNALLAAFGRERLADVVDLFDLSSNEFIGTIRPIWDVDYLGLSRDGELMVTAYFGRNTHVEVWSPTVLERIADIEIKGVSRAMALSPDGKLLAIVSEENEVIFFDLETESEVGRSSVSKHLPPVTCIAFSSDRSRIAIGSRAFRGWGLRALGAPILHFKIQEDRETNLFTTSEWRTAWAHLERVTSIEFAREDELIASASYPDLAMHILDLVEHKSFELDEAPHKHGYFLNLSRSGRRYAIIGNGSLSVGWVESLFTNGDKP